MNGVYNVGDYVLGSWQLTRLIGAGSYGKVFEATREDMTGVYRSAVKIVTIPSSPAEVDSARSEGMDDASLTRYFRGMVEEIAQECTLMAKLKGTAHVVSYEDHAVLEHQGTVGWDVIIRMELLTPLVAYSTEHPMSRDDVVRLGIDMCRALELCARHSIVHRDIKPENIFLSADGYYKLGDFGIARTIERTTALSRKGTYTYMAPEVYRDEPYNATVDIYSLGLVMYRFLNGNRTPFLPPPPAPITHVDRENALAKRISGYDLPDPVGADPALARVVQRACAFLPQNRYQSPTQMREDLEALQVNREPPVPTPPVPAPPAAETAESPRQREKTGGGFPILTFLAVLLLAAAAGWFFLLGPGRGMLRLPEREAAEEAAPEEHEDFEGHAYALVISSVSWTGMREEAARQGGRLAAFETEEEFRQVADMIADAGLEDVFFRLGGRRDEDGDDYRWVDADNEPYGGRLNGKKAWLADWWYEGEPNFSDRGTPESCLEMAKLEKDGDWLFFDVPDEWAYPAEKEKRGYILEFDTQKAYDRYMAADEPPEGAAGYP